MDLFCSDHKNKFFFYHLHLLLVFQTHLGFGRLLLRGRLLTFCLSIGEFPAIRYQRGPTSASKIASQLNDLIRPIEVRTLLSQKKKRVGWGGRGIDLVYSS